MPASLGFQLFVNLILLLHQQVQEPVLLLIHCALYGFRDEWAGFRNLFTVTRNLDGKADFFSGVFSGNIVGVEIYGAGNN